MKKVLLIGLAIAHGLLLTVNGLAQAPKKMNYQGVARDVNGQTLVDKTISLRLSILSAENINAPVYTEEQTVKTNSFGLFAIKIGEGTAVTGAMQDIDWGSADHFISVELDAENNGHYAFMGTSQLLSVPYAFYAERSGIAEDVVNIDQLRAIDFGGIEGQTIRHNGSDWEATSSIFNSGGNVGVGTTVPAAKLDIDGGVNLSTGNEYNINGTRALALNGDQNVMIGHQAGDDVTTGKRNLFIGWQAGRDLSTGENNTMLGYRAGFVTTDGRNNNMIGNLAGFSNTIGNNNSFIGYRAGYSNTTGLNNYYAGTNAGHNGTTGLNNLALGTAAGFSLGAGSDNTLIGRNAGYNTSGDANVFIGKEAGMTDTSGTNNTYVGTSADGVGNLTNATALGANAYVSSSNSVVLGNAANVGIGTSAPGDELHVVGDVRVDGGRIVFKNTGNSIFVGDLAGNNDNGSDNFNVGIGFASMNRNTTGLYNTAIGTASLQNNTTGNSNVAMGESALYANTTGGDNVAIGKGAASSVETLGRNTAVGSKSLGSVTGANNTAVGYEALAVYGSGTRNTALGYKAGNSSTSRINATAIGANTEVGCDSCLVLGDASKVGVGTTTPADELHVVGNIRMVDGNQATGYIPVSDSNGTMTWTDPSTLAAADSDWTISGNNQYSAVSGNVGIGTNSPADKLHLVGDLRLDVGKINIQNTGGSVIIGEDAGAAENLGSSHQSIFIGTQAGNANTTGTYNSAIGAYTLASNISGTSNIAIGATSLNFITTGSYNSAIGVNALSGGGVTNARNTAFGYDAGSSTTGSGNIFLGYQAGKSKNGSNKLYIENSNADSTNALIFGNFDADVLTVNGTLRVNDGNQQQGYVAVTDSNGFMTWTDPSSLSGADSDWTVSDTNMYAAVSGNVGVGTTTPADKLHVVGDMRVDAGAIKVSNTGGSVLIGNTGGYSDDFSDNRNVFIGTQNTGRNTTTGSHNVGVGSYSLSDNTTGLSNTALGYGALGGAVTTGSGNTALGADALTFSADTCEYNLAIGNQAGAFATGSNNVFIGFRAGLNHGGSNKLFIVNNSADKNSALIYGEFDNQLLAFNANVGVGTSSPADELHVVGNIRMADGNQAAGYIPVSDANGTMTWTDPSTITAADDGDWTVSGNNQYSAVSGNVGVGTTSPAGKLHVRNGKLIIDQSRIEFMNVGSSIFIGTDAGLNDNWTENRNVAVGYEALKNNGGGEENVAIGYRALYTSGGDYNVAVGPSALAFHTSGDFNTAFGAYALDGNFDGIANTAVGQSALGSNTNGDYNTAIGNNADVASDNLTNATAVGANASVACDSCLVLGDASNVGIGTTTPAYKLDVPSSTSNEVVAHFGQANISNKGTLNFHILNDNLEGYNVGFGQNSGGLTTIGSYNHDIEFYTDSAATKEVMRIYNDGRAYVNYDFGFGTNNPGLQVSIGTSGTGLENDGSNNLQVYNSGAERARFTSTGNLGIGTTDPKAALHVTEIATGFSWTPFSQTSAILERNGGSLLSLVTNNGGISSVVMGDADSQFSGRVRYEHTDDRMEFWTSNSEKVSILSNGNVGIGSKTPAEKLDIAGSIRIVDGNQGAGKVLISDANGTGSWQSPGAIVTDGDWTISGNDLYNDNSGNVGVGTTTPSNKLHVAGSIRMTDGNQAAGYIPISDANGKMTWTDPTTQIGYSPFKLIDSKVMPDTAVVDEAVTSFIFGSTQMDDDAESGHYNRMFFEKFKGAFRAGGVAGTHWNDGLVGSGSFAAGYNNIASGDYSFAGGLGNLASGDYSTAFGLGTTASGDNSFASGNITYAPSAWEFTVGAFSTNYTPNSTTGYNANDRIFTVGNGSSFGSTSNAMVILKNGNVGVGYSTPAYKLEVNGQVAGTSAYVNTSDKRFKTNIQPIGDAMDKINQLQGVSYDWKAKEYPEKHFDNRKQLGFVAQDVESIVPEAVSIDTEGNYGLSYSTFIPVMVEAMKELQEEVEALQYLKAENEELRKMIEEMQKAKR